MTLNTRAIQAFQKLAERKKISFPVAVIFSNYSGRNLIKTFIGTAKVDCIWCEILCKFVLMQLLSNIR